MKILIADQIRDQRTIIRVMCAGHWVKEASHSTEAIAKAKDFDLIFTEITFPGLAGNEYLSALRKATKAKIVVVTAQTEGYEQMDMVITKPFYKREIIEALANFKT